MATNYQRGKERARELAVAYSNEVGEMTQSWGEAAEMADKFRKLGRRYGLLREFRENGIC